MGDIESLPDVGALQEELERSLAFLSDVRSEIHEVLVGQEELVDTLLMGVLCDGHVLVEGVPGLAKTLAVSTLAQVIGGKFARVQFTPDLLPADLVGTSIYNPGEQSFTARLGPVFANVVLADEVNRAPAKVQSALLEAMQEHQVSIGDSTYDLPNPFLVMATQNPIEQEGTYPLPEAQLDRFMFKASVGYPSRDEEHRIMQQMGKTQKGTPVSAVITPERIVEGRKMIDRIYLDPKVEEYILDIVFATRPGESGQLSNRQEEADLSDLDGLVAYGVSPRASLALYMAARARAVLSKRAYVLPQDVKDVAFACLRHRIIPTYEAEAESLTPDDILGRLLNELRTP